MHFYLRVENDSSTVIAKQDPEVNHLDLGYLGYSGYSDLSATKFEEPEVTQVQGKPRMHSTLP